MPTKLEMQIVSGRPSGHAITLYGLSFCEHCVEGREFLTNAGVEFEYAYLDSYEAPIRAHAIARLRRAYGKKLIYPILEVDGELYFGFVPEEWKEAIGI